MTSTDSSPDQAPTLDLTGEASPYPYYAYRRRTDPVWRGTVNDYSQAPPEMASEEEWTLFDYDSVAQAFRESARFSSDLYNQTIGLVLGPTILGMAGKEHHSHRNLVARAFRATALQRWEPLVISPVCDELTDEIKNDGQADLVESVTLEFPTRIIATLLGLPREDLDMFRELSLGLISIATDIEGGLNASAAFGDYFLGQIEQRRRTMTDDVIGDLVAAEIDGSRLTDEAIVSFLRLLLPAGLETTYRSSGSLLYLLLTHPDQLHAIQQDRSLISAAIEEGLRYETPLTTVLRLATEDIPMAGGKVIPAGATIDVCIGSANRDETRWHTADTFDVHRDRLPHVSFAGGIHTCLGIHLARHETRAMLNSLFDRITDLELNPADDPRIVGLTFRSPNSLPVTYRPLA